MMSGWRWASVLGLCGIVLGGAAYAEGSYPSAAPLFAAVLPAPDESPVRLESLKGKPLIINFWARWCPPCRQEIPLLSKLPKQKAYRDVVVLGIAIEDNAEPLREFVKAYDIDYPVVLGREQGMPLMQALGNKAMGLPYTLAINRAGEIVYAHAGGMKAADLNRAADAALKTVSPQTSR